MTLSREVFPLLLSAFLLGKAAAWAQGVNACGVPVDEDGIPTDDEGFVSVVILGTDDVNDKQQGMFTDDTSAGSDGFDLHPLTEGQDVILDFDPAKDMLDVGDFARPSDGFGTLQSLGDIAALSTQTSIDGQTALVIDVDGPFGSSTTTLFGVTIDDLDTTNVFFGLEGTSIPPQPITWASAQCVTTETGCTFIIPGHGVPGSGGQGPVDPPDPCGNGSGGGGGGECFSNTPAQCGVATLPDGSLDDELFATTVILGTDDVNDKQQGMGTDDITTGGGGFDLHPLTLGQDVITDFDPARDMLDVGDFARASDEFATLQSLEDIAALSAQTTVLGQTALVIDVDGPLGNSTTTLLGITIDDLTADNVFFGLGGTSIPPQPVTWASAKFVTTVDGCGFTIPGHAVPGSSGEEPADPPAPPGCQTLEAPSKLRLRQKARRALTVLWRDNSDDETGFEIERRVVGTAAFELVATVGADTRRFRDRGLEPGMAYVYRVRAVDNGGPSSWSNLARARTRP